MIKYVFLCLSAFSFFSCQTEENIPQDPCGEKSFIRMFVRDTLGNPYVFTSSRTYLDDTLLILSYDALIKPSALVVVSDDQIDKISYSSSSLKVLAYNSKDSLILDTLFTIKRDTCHVRYVKGPLEVVVR